MTFKVKTKGQNEGEKLLVPKLRFKEFKNEWNEITLKKLLSFKNGINGDKDSYGYGIKYISVGDILNNTYITYDKIKGLIDINDKTLKENSVEYGDMVFQRSSETFNDIGQANVYLDKKQIATFGGFVIRGKKIGNYNPLFFNYLLKSPCNRKKVIVKGAGAQHYNISQEELEKIKVNFTVEKEQVKIANLFYSLDKKIELQQRKIEALKIYKTGVCQKLFQSIKDDKTTFKMQISKFLKERKIYSEKGLEYPHVTLSKDGILDKSDRYNRDFLVMSNNKEYKITLLNDLCYNPANLKFGVICINEYGSAIFSPIYVTLEINPNIMDVSFCKYYFTRIDFINKVRKYEQGTVYERMSVNVEDFLKHTDVFPCLENQRKIAKILSNLDRKINLQKNTLNNLNILKKSLLQQMFI
ncbi:restriction endonuclease subunit S [bacterium]|nr:restriction endonuclease subunit S [bacterium]